MSYLDSSLAGDEELTNRFLQHWLVWMEAWLLLLMAGVCLLGLLWTKLVPTEDVPAFIRISFLVGSAALTPYGIWKAIEIKSREFGLTDRRIISKRGVISRNTSEIKLTAAETVTLKQSLAARMMGCGNVIVTGRGNAIVAMTNIDDPMDVKKAIENQIAKARKGYVQPEDRPGA